MMSYFPWWLILRDGVMQDMKSQKLTKYLKPKRATEEITELDIHSLNGCQK